MHGEIITVCGIQLDCIGGNESTLNNAEKYIAEAFKYNSDIDLIVMPEIETVKLLAIMKKFICLMLLM